MVTGDRDLSHEGRCSRRSDAAGDSDAEVLETVRSLRKSLPGAMKNLSALALERENPIRINLAVDTRGVLERIREIARWPDWSPDEREELREFTEEVVAMLRALT